MKRIILVVLMLVLQSCIASAGYAGHVHAILVAPEMNMMVSDTTKHKALASYKNYTDPVPAVYYNGLVELFYRKSMNAAAYKDVWMDSLYNRTTRQCEPELCIFKDATYGTEIWRLCNDPRSNVQHHHINRTPWNCNGSGMILRSWRVLPGFNSGIIWLTGDCDTMFTVAPSPITLATYYKYPCPSRTDPRVIYMTNLQGLWAVDPYSTGMAKRIASFADSAYGGHGVRKETFSYPSENGMVMATSVNPTDCTNPDVSKRNYDNCTGQTWTYMVNTNTGAVAYYNMAFNLTGITGHSTSEEYHLHDIYFRRGADTTYVFNYGPRGDPGEDLFFEGAASGDPAKVKLCYSKSGAGLPYYSHPAWNANGSLVAYLNSSSGCYCLTLRRHDTDTDLQTFARYRGGHNGWDGYDTTRAVSCGDYGNPSGMPDTLIEVTTANSTRRILTMPWSGINGDYSLTYDGEPRPAQSPDGTKVYYASTMLQSSDSWSAESYVAVSHYPTPPDNLRVSAIDDYAVTLTWEKPYPGKEVKCYHIYRQAYPSGTWGEIATSPVSALTCVDDGLPLGVPFRYGVTTEEYSGLESRTMSRLVDATVNVNLDPDSNIVVGVSKTEWDTTPPAKPGNFAVYPRHKAGGDYFTNKLVWGRSTSKDLSYYNIYYSRVSNPVVSQARLIGSVRHNRTYFWDWKADPTHTDYYGITAVDRQGNESAATYKAVKITDPETPIQY